MRDYSGRGIRYHADWAVSLKASIVRPELNI
jgi:hypothetical protein